MGSCWGIQVREEYGLEQGNSSRSIKRELDKGSMLKAETTGFVCGLLQRSGDRRWVEWRNQQGDWDGTTSKGGGEEKGRGEEGAVVVAF